MTTHDQHQDATEFTTAPADFTDGQGGNPTPVADPTTDRGPTAAADDAVFTDSRGSADPGRSDAAHRVDSDADPGRSDADHGVDRDQRLDQTQTQAQSQAQAQGQSHALPTDDALFADHDLSDLRSRWNEVQATFVDDPRDCVAKADGLVSDTVQQLTSSFSHARSRLEEQWSRGEEASTEELRLALKRYRDFFDRLLAV